LRKFFGRNLDDSGTEILLKLGSRYPNINDPRHYISWRDGMVIDTGPIGFNNGKRVGFSTLLLQFPNIRYAGRHENNWKKSNRIINDFRKFTYPVDDKGNHPWDYKSKDGYMGEARKRDYFVDTLELMMQNYITLGEYEIIYDFSQKASPVVIPDSSFNHLLKHEDGFYRSCIETDIKKGSVESGTYSIGAALDYATVTAFEADIGAAQDGDLSGEHNDESTVIASNVAFNHDPNGHKFTLTAQTGDEHSGTLGNAVHQAGDGARVTYGNSDQISLMFGANADEWEISKLVLDATGVNNKGAYANRGIGVINRMVIAGTATDNIGIEISRYHGTIYITNNIIYGFGNGSGEAGILISSLYTDGIIYAYNNTAIKNYNGILLSEHDGDPTITLINNLCQGSGNEDYAEDSAQTYDSTARNVSEDATSPDGGIYDNLNCHDGNSCFTDYASDEYTYDSGGDEIATLEAGNDLTGTFTDSVRAAGVRTSSEFFIGADWIDTGGGDVIGTHTAHSIALTKGTHIGKVDKVYPHTSHSLAVTTGTHTGVVDVIGIHTAFPLAVTKGSHTGKIDSIGIHTAHSIAVTKGTHVGKVDIIGIHTVFPLALTKGTHVAVGDVIGIHTAYALAVTKGTHAGPVDILGAHTAHSLALTLGTHVGYVSINGEHTALEISVTKGNHIGVVDIIGIHSTFSLAVSLGTHVGIVTSDDGIAAWGSKLNISISITV